MENFDQPLDTGAASAPTDGLQITPEIRMFWRQTVPWTMFLAILLFVFFGLVALFGLLATFAAGAAGLIGGLFLVGIYGAILFFPALYYYRFTIAMKQALKTEDNAALDSSFRSLSQFYRYVGILTIVFLALILVYLVVFGAVLMNSARGFN